MSRPSTITFAAPLEIDGDEVVVTVTASLYYGDGSLDDPDDAEIDSIEAADGTPIKFDDLDGGQQDMLINRASETGAGRGLPVGDRWDLQD